MTERRSEGPGRRAEDWRWEKVQEQVMNLVTAQRSSQGALERLEKEVAMLIDHVEDVDEHLRGVGGKESMDTRVSVMEKDVFKSGVILDGVTKHVGALEKELASLKFHQAIAKDAEIGRMERFKAWLRFWGPIIVATIALAVPLTKMAVDNWDKINPFPRKSEYRPDEKLKKEIEADKKKQREIADKKKRLERAKKSSLP